MLLAAILAIGAVHAADPGNFGAGVVVGDTTGLSLGYRPTEWNAVEVGLGWDALDSALKGSADYLQSVAVIDPNRHIRIPLYVGLGADVGRDYVRGETGGRAPAAIEPGGAEGGATEGAANNWETGVSARVPIGASILFMDRPVELFGHVIPSYTVIGDRRLDVDGSVGVRYYF